MAQMTDVKAAIVRIDESIARIDKTIARMDERINSTRTLLFAIFVPLHLLTLATLFGLLTRGSLWAVAPERPPPPPLRPIPHRAETTRDAALRVGSPTAAVLSSPFRRFPGRRRLPSAAPRPSQKELC